MRRALASSVDGASGVVGSSMRVCGSFAYPGGQSDIAPARRADTAGATTSATTTASRINAPPSALVAVIDSPVTALSSAANTGSSSRIRAALDGLTILCAQTMARKATAVANTPVNAAAPSAAASSARPWTAAGARQAAPTVASCTVVSRIGSCRAATSPRNTRWAAKATAQPSVRTSPRPNPTSAPPVSRPSPTTASATPEIASGCGRWRVTAYDSRGTNTTSMYVMKAEVAAVVYCKPTVWET